MFNAGIEIGETIKNSELVNLFKCGIMGTRHSLSTGTLVLVIDKSKGFYLDKLKNGLIYYTGMGKTGNQELKGNQNLTLYNSNSNGVELHMFIAENGEYEYIGIVKLVKEPFQEIQQDINGDLRKVWIFPLKAISNKSLQQNKDTFITNKEQIKTSK